MGWRSRQNPTLITNLRKGKAPSFEHIRVLREVLGLEFHIGRVRTVRRLHYPSL